MNKSYKRALEMERWREVKWRQTAQGAFESSMMSLDALTANYEKPDKLPLFSDGGAAVEQMNAADDERERERKIAAALSHLSHKEREFAEAILGGKMWQDMGYKTHPAFYRRLDRVIARITQIQKSLKNGDFGNL